MMSFANSSLRFIYYTYQFTTITHMVSTIENGRLLHIFQCKIKISLCKKKNRVVPCYCILVHCNLSQCLASFEICISINLKNRILLAHISLTLLFGTSKHTRVLVRGGRYLLLQNVQCYGACSLLQYTHNFMELSQLWTFIYFFSFKHTGRPL